MKFAKIMREERVSRSGMAVVVVLVFAIALLTFGIFFIQTIMQQTPINLLQLASVQADLLAQGVTQIATLKFKELPGPLYYAAIAKKNFNSNPINTYKNDVLLVNSNYTEDQFAASFTTEYSMLSSQVYRDMNIKIEIWVDVRGRDSRWHKRKVEHIVGGTRSGI